MKGRMQLISFLVLTLSNCSGIVTNPTVSEIQVGLTTSPELQATDLLAEVAPTATPEVSGVITSCPVIIDGLPDGLVGKIILSGQENADSFILDLESKSYFEIPRASGQEFVDFDYSPNRSNFVFAIENSQGLKIKLQILDSTGRILTTIPWQTNWWMISDWITENQIVIGTLTKDQYGLDEWGLLILDIDNGQATPLTFNFADVFDMGVEIRDWLGYGLTGVIFDPSFSIAIYAKHPDKLDVSEIVLWDLVENSLVREISTKTFFGNTPVWDSQNERFFINISSTLPLDTMVVGEVGLNQELYALDKQGNLEKLTNLESFYGESELGQVALSPDGKKIAFWLATPHEFPVPFNYESFYTLQRISVLDISSGTTTNFCIAGDQASYNFQPIWSPDSMHLLLEHITSWTDRQTYILDIQNAIAYQIAEQLSPEAWLITGQ